MTSVSTGTGLAWSSHMTEGSASDHDADEMIQTTGNVKCAALKLTGGGDLAEPFDVENTPAPIREW